MFLTNKDDDDDDESRGKQVVLLRGVLGWVPDRIHMTVVIDTAVSSKVADDVYQIDSARAATQATMVAAIAPTDNIVGVLVCLRYIGFSRIFFSGVPLMECCRVDDTSPENTVVGLPPWIPMLAV